MSERDDKVIWVISAVTARFALAQWDVTIVSIALPQIAGRLQACIDHSSGWQTVRHWCSRRCS